MRQRHSDKGKAELFVAYSSEKEKAVSQVHRETCTQGKELLRAANVRMASGVGRGGFCGLLCAG